VQLKKDRPSAFRVVGDTDGADTIMRQALFLGTYPGLTLSMIDYQVETVREYLRSF
jgi:CDP-6-deoxy-D-xylo-4-hexulose-3-dehydrase